MKEPRIVVFAYSDVGYACLKFLLDRQENVVCVYTHQDKPDENTWFPSVKKYAESCSVFVEADDNLLAAEKFYQLQKMSPDLILSFYYRQLIPSQMLALPRLGAFNMHGSLLPKYRGRAPVNWAILNGEKKTGATLHAMVDKADAGDIVDQEEVLISPDDTAPYVQAEITQAAVKILSRQIENLKSAKAPRFAQDHSQATYFGRRRPEDGEIRWDWPAHRIHNFVRALTRPYPGAFGELFGEKVWIWKSRLSQGGKASDGLFVRCGDGNSVELLSVQKKGELEITGREFMERYVAIGRKLK